ncbi:RNA-directed DNA polymerase, eukaryota, Reverse transcriptase zinc-binding domain protein [Artemisia annua]|uniref:RNA-directed DNA polymerase, eukaryota, Reverse transcriptase zinc-binding domain protein n=1 Tax=Artemisia annua TaxID=35608 RepID=A0A2U1KY17_ARTAN|nr:RNA-directed DNA polymerase, eukaryota, Reverse transcriptase zinc-binding domain protein [Artemisia annua]
MARLENVGNDWASVISAIVNKTANNTIWSVIQRMVFGASVYYIWYERNSRRVNHVCRSEEGVFKSIVDTVRLRLLGLNLKYTPQVCKASEIWNNPVRCIEKILDSGNVTQTMLLSLMMHLEMALVDVVQKLIYFMLSSFVIHCYVIELGICPMPSVFCGAFV